MAIDWLSSGDFIGSVLSRYDLVRGRAAAGTGGAPGKMMWAGAPAVKTLRHGFRTINNHYPGGSLSEGGQNLSVTQPALHAGPAGGERDSARKRRTLRPARPRAGITPQGRYFECQDETTTRDPRLSGGHTWGHGVAVGVGLGARRHAPATVERMTETAGRDRHPHSRTAPPVRLAKTVRRPRGGQAPAQGRLPGGAVLPVPRPAPSIRLWQPGAKARGTGPHRPAAGHDAGHLFAGVAQWQSGGLPSRARGFDSRCPLHSFAASALPGADGPSRAGFAAMPGTFFAAAASPRCRWTPRPAGAVARPGTHARGLV